MDKSYEQHLYFGDTHLGSILGHQLSRSEVYFYEFLLSPLVNSEIDQILLFVSGLVPDSKIKPERQVRSIKVYGFLSSKCK
jgi:hypothetical protein